MKARSEEYLFVSRGVVNVSGIEYISASPTADVQGLRLPRGRWVAQVHYLEWPEDLYKGKRSPPDFLVLLNPEEERGKTYRVSVETFDRNPLGY